MESSTKPLSSYTISELRRICKDNEVECEPKMKKAQLIELLEEMDELVIKAKGKKGRARVISAKSKPSIFVHIQGLEKDIQTYPRLTAFEKSKQRADILNNIIDKLENYDWSISDEKFKKKVELFRDRLEKETDESVEGDGTMDFEEDPEEVPEIIKPSIEQRIPNVGRARMRYRTSTNPKIKREALNELKLMLQKYDWKGYESVRENTEALILRMETSAPGGTFLSTSGDDDGIKIQSSRIVDSKIKKKQKMVEEPKKITPKKTPSQRYVPGVYKPLDLGVEVKFTKKGEKVREGTVVKKITITLDEFRREIKKPEFIKAFTSSARELMKAKEVVYQKRLTETQKEYNSLKMKVFRLRASGTSDRTITEMYPGYDTMGAYIIDIENVIELVRERGETITELEVGDGLEEALEDPDDGIAALMGRTEIKDQLASQLYSFSKGYKTFFGNFNNIVITGPPGSGKCLHPDTPVMLYSGRVIKASQVMIGNRLMGDDSTPRTVLSTCTGTEEMYKITPVKGDPYIVNKPHILSLKHSHKPGISWDGVNSYRVRWCDDEGNNKVKKFFATKGCTKDHAKILATKFKNTLPIKDIILDIPVAEYIKKSASWKKHWKGYKVGVDFAETKEKLAIDPYLLGLWLGDGTTKATEITNIDPEIIEYLKKEMKTMNMYVNQYEGPEGIRYYLGGNERRVNPFLKELQKHGLIGFKFIPRDYKTASRENRLRLLAGIIDTDGSYQNGCYDIIQKSNILAKDILFVARSLGFAAYSVKCKKGCWYKGEYKEGEYNRISLSGDMCEIPCLLPRKKCAPRKQIKNVLNTGITVEPVGKGTYCGFELDGNHRFLLGDFTVTHNTRLAKTIAFAFSKVGILGRGIVKIVTRTELVGQYIGHTAPRTRGALLETLEGVLFIDEAYQLTPCPEDRVGSKDFGSEAITEMVNFLDKYIGLNIVIVAGYEGVMNRCFMTANEGLPRRFPYRYVLSAYTVPELTDILVNNLKRKVRDGVVIDDETGNFLYSMVDKLFIELPEVFKNQAGDMLNLSSNINNAINSSYRVEWINGNLSNNKQILISGFDDFLESKGYSIDTTSKD
jgi:hypothetical protein